ncbi:alpha/beta-hydrolase [Hymenopellis radicata]|nr:alpha/beta-hydrolase [Hymenopellis radicata]
MYASEKATNFRWIAKLVASTSSYTLTENDLAPSDVEIELEEIGQYAEIASNNTIPISFILTHIDQLVQPRFPLEGYTALKGSILIADFFGSVSDLHSYVTYRPPTKQLIVAISGTILPVQAIQDLRFLFQKHPSGRGRVHTGFWTLYEGLKDSICNAMAQGFREHDVEELVLTGHSMGGAISYLLALDILTGTVSIPAGCRIKTVTFGSPRAGDDNLVRYWRECASSITELCVKGYNDGVHALPPSFLGYRHFTENCFYWVNERLYRVPSSECESSLFRAPPSPKPPLYPKGGHNYYNGHDMEKVFRRFKLIDVKCEDWVEAYMSQPESLRG